MSQLLYSRHSSRVKILYLNPNGTMGGAERALLDLMRAVREARPDWSLELVVPADGDFSAAARAHGIDTHILPLPPAVARLGDAGAGGPAGDGISKAALLGRLALSRSAARGLCPRAEGIYWRCAIPT